jgi:hypothetical protein
MSLIKKIQSLKHDKANKWILTHIKKLGLISQN